MSILKQGSKIKRFHLLVSFFVLIVVFLGVVSFQGETNIFKKLTGNLLSVLVGGNLSIEFVDPTPADKEVLFSGTVSINTAISDSVEQSAFIDLDRSLVG